MEDGALCNIVRVLSVCEDEYVYVKSPWSLTKKIKYLVSIHFWHGDVEKNKIGFV